MEICPKCRMEFPDGSVSCFLHKLRLVEKAEHAPRTFDASAHSSYAFWQG